MAGTGRPTRNSQPKDSVSISDLFLPDATPITSKKQLKDKFNNLDLYDVFLGVLMNNRTSAILVSQLTTRVQELEDLVEDLRDDMVIVKEKLKNSLEPQSRDLDDRLLRQEAYSGRNTIIVAELPEADSETPDSLQNNLLDMFKKTDPTITRQDIGIAHRNGKTKKPDSAGRSVTCVLMRASKKDMIMRKDSRSKLKTDHKVQLFHRMSDGLRQRKKELEELGWVKWVAFSGHRMFTVCIEKEKDKFTYIKNVLRAEDVKAVTGEY